MSTPEQLLHFDKNAIPALLGDSNEFVESVLNMVVEELQRAVTAIKKHAAAQEIPEIANEVHKLYGTSLTAGLPALGAVTQQLEQIKDWSAEETAALLQQLETEAQTATGEIQAFLAETRGSGSL